MSACISRHGEYGSHTFAEAPANIWEEFTCERCGVLSEYAMADEIARLRAAVEASRPRVVTAGTSDWRLVVASDPDHFEQLYERDGFEGQALCVDGGGTHWLLAATEDGPWFDGTARADASQDRAIRTARYHFPPSPVESGETQGGAS